MKGVWTIFSFLFVLMGNEVFTVQYSTVEVPAKTVVVALSDVLRTRGIRRLRSRTVHMEIGGWNTQPVVRL